MQIRPDALNRKLKDVLKNKTDKRLLIKNKTLLNKNLFINRTFILEENIKELEYTDLGLEESGIIGGTEYIYKLKVLNRKFIDDLITESYETFI